MGTKNPFGDQENPCLKKTLINPIKQSIWGFPLVLQSAQQLLAWGVQRCDPCLSFPLYKGTGIEPLPWGLPRLCRQTLRSTKLLPGDEQDSSALLHPAQPSWHKVSLWQGVPGSEMPPTSLQGQKGKSSHSLQNRGSEALVAVRIDHIFVCVSLHTELHPYTPAQVNTSR